MFQLDDQYQSYIDNKKACRREGIDKYYQESSLAASTSGAVNSYLAEQMAEEHPGVFSLSNRCLQNKLTGEAVSLDGYQNGEGMAYVSTFDALCCQVQEDIAVFQLEGDDDWLAAVHLCAPNHWSPADKVGLPFSRVHQPVPDMENTIRRYPAMLKSIVEKGGPYTRFAWGISTDTRLNHHPEAPSDEDPVAWHGRQSGQQEYFVRVERQNLVGLPEAGAFIFTIRTYFYAFDELDSRERAALASAINTMSAATLEYKGLTDKKDWLIRVLTE